MDKRIAASKFREWFDKEGFDEDSPVRTVALYAFLQGVELASGVNSIKVNDTVVFKINNLSGEAVFDRHGNVMNNPNNERLGVVTKIVQRDDADKNRVFTIKTRVGKKERYYWSQHSESGWIRKFGEINQK